MIEIANLIKGNSIDYPSADEVTHIRTNSLICYVNSGFCVGLLNMLDNLSAYLIARNNLNGVTPDSINTSCLEDNDKILRKYFENIKSLSEISKQDWIHTNYWEFCHDDVIITGESEKHYYFFWLDHDVSDCSICKISKFSYEDIDCFNEAVLKYVSEDCGYKINEIRKPDGYIHW